MRSKVRVLSPRPWTYNYETHVPLTLLIDFDSTLVEIETLDELARIALEDLPDRTERLNVIHRLTAEGMAGKIGFGESLRKRLAQLTARQEHIAMLVNLTRSRVTPSFREEARSLLSEVDELFVISGGFREIIIPVVAEFGIRADHVLANSFMFDAGGMIMGAEEANPMAHDLGKIAVARSLSLRGSVIIVGDGHTDWQVADAGVADAFIAFTENVARPAVISRTNLIARNFGEVRRLATAAASFDRQLGFDPIHAEAE
jgi:D-3-phosphoglycerate dehydrogenase